MFMKKQIPARPQPEHSGDRLSKALSALGMKGADLTRVLKLENPQNVTNWRRRGVPAKELTRTADALNLEREWLEFGKGKMLRDAGPALEPGPDMKGGFRTIQIVGTAQLGPDGYWTSLDAGDGWIEAPTNDPDAYALRVKGDSMMPAIRSGWVAWCEPNKPLVVLEYVMIKHINGECMIKELIKESPDEIVVQAINQDYGRLTISRARIEKIHYVGGIVPPSKIRM